MVPATFCSAARYKYVYGSEKHFIPPLGRKRMVPNNILFFHWVERYGSEQHFILPLGRKRMVPNNILFFHWVERYGSEQHFIPPLGRKRMTPTTFCSANR
jgi:hypothetical protein